MLRTLRLCAPLGPAIVMTLIVGCTDFPSPPATTPAASSLTHVSALDAVFPQ